MRKYSDRQKCFRKQTPLIPKQTKIEPVNFIRGHSVQNQIISFTEPNNFIKNQNKSHKTSNQIPKNIVKPLLIT